MGGADASIKVEATAGVDLARFVEHPEHST
jgi:hypothetical protein